MDQWKDYSYWYQFPNVHDGFFLMIHGKYTCMNFLLHVLREILFWSGDTVATHNIYVTGI